MYLIICGDDYVHVMFHVLCGHSLEPNKKRHEKTAVLRKMMFVTKSVSVGTFLMGWGDELCSLFIQELELSTSMHVLEKLVVRPGDSTDVFVSQLNKNQQRYYFFPTCCS